MHFQGRGWWYPLGGMPGCTPSEVLPGSDETLPSLCLSFKPPLKSPAPTRRESHSTITPPCPALPSPQDGIQVPRLDLCRWTACVCTCF